MRSFSSAKSFFVDDLLLEETGVAGLVDLRLAHHLTNDDFEVLVVDLHTLEAIDVLHLVDDVLLHGGGTLDGEDVAGGGATVGEGSTGAHEVVFLYEDLLGEGDKVFLDLAELGGNDDFAVARLMAPMEISPSISETTAGLEGLRASKSSVTRGRPPVMSPAEPTTAGILTMMSPALSTC